MAADIERLTNSAVAGLQGTLVRVGSLLRGVAVLTAIVGVATFLTGLWVFHNGLGWIVIGGLLCAIPIAAAVIGWRAVARMARRTPQLVDDVRSLLRTSRQSATVLIDHDTGQSIAVTSRSFRSLREELQARRSDLPALFAGVKAVTSAPGLAALAVIGILFVGALGTILLIAGLVR